jgi:ribonuclease T
VLSRAVIAAGIDWNSEDAHSAVYDAERTADLFCTIVNRWDEARGILALGGSESELS